MSQIGYIYVLANTEIKTHCKIGITTRTPSERAKDINVESPTGRIGDWYVYRSYPTADLRQVETNVHRSLSKFATKGGGHEQ